MSDLAHPALPALVSKPTEDEQEDSVFLFSASLFRAGFFLVTFEQVRPFGIEIADYFFFLSFLILLPSFRSRILRERGSGILLAGALIFSGSLLSLVRDADLTDLGGSFTRLFTLYGLFAPLALIHSKQIRRNMLSLIAGISANCAIATIEVYVFPGIVDLLSINPVTTDSGEIFRHQGLTQFPVTLGLTAALALLLSFGLLLFERRARMRWGLALSVLLCTEGALLSGSRTFLAALIPGLIVLGLLLKQHRGTVLRSIAGLLVLCGFLTLLAPRAVSDYTDRLGEVGLIDYGRIVVAAQALGDISQRPLLGWGFNHFKDAGLTWLPGMYGNEPQGVHVTLLLYWYGAGLLGAAGFLALFAFPVRQMRRVLAGPPGGSTNAVRLGLAVYVSIFIIFALGPYLYNRYLYMPLFLFAGFAARASQTCVEGSLVRREAAENGPVSGLGRREPSLSPGNP